VVQLGLQLKPSQQQTHDMTVFINWQQCKHLSSNVVIWTNAGATTMKWQTLFATVKSHRHAFLPKTKIWLTIFKCCLKQLSLFLASAWSNVWNAFILCGHHAHEHDDHEHVEDDNKNPFGWMSRHDWHLASQNKTKLDTCTHTCCWQLIDAQNSSTVLTLSCIGKGSHGCTSCKDKKNLLDSNPLCHAKETKLNAIDPTPSLLPQHFFLLSIQTAFFGRVMRIWRWRNNVGESDDLALLNDEFWHWSIGQRWTQMQVFLWFSASPFCHNVHLHSPTQLHAAHCISDHLGPLLMSSTWEISFASLAVTILVIFCFFSTAAALASGLFDTCPVEETPSDRGFPNGLFLLVKPLMTALPQTSQMGTVQISLTKSGVVVSRCACQTRGGAPETVLIQMKVPVRQCSHKKRCQWDVACMWKGASETVLKNVGG